MVFVGILGDNFEKDECSCPRRKKTKYSKCWCKRVEEVENVPSVLSLNGTTCTTMFDVHTRGKFGVGENIIKQENP